MTFEEDHADIDASIERIDELIISLGYKKCFEWSSSDYRKGNKTLWQRYIHPVSGRVYRFQDVAQIVQSQDNDDEEFYKEATRWSKRVNTLFEEAGCKVEEDDVFLYTYKLDSGTTEMEYYLVIEPRPIEWDDLSDDLKAVPYWQEKFGRQ